MIKSRFVFTLLLVIYSCTSYAQSVARHNLLNEFKRKIYISLNDSLLYRILYRVNYDKSKKYPLVLFLAGDGARGNDNDLQLTAIPNSLIGDLERVKYPCFILAPQCPKKQVWVKFSKVEESLQSTPEPTPPARLTLALMDQLIDKLPVNRQKIYITGYSGGGEGTLDFIMRRPEFFAAAVPICSVSDTSKAHLIAKIPIWAFHGENDNINPVKYSRLLVEALKLHGGSPKYTEYPDVGHNSWTKAYEEPGLMEWLFTQP